MGTHEVKLERAGEKSAVDSSDPVCHKFILDHVSSGRVTHDSHKLQTKAINHSTRHYMNRRKLESIYVPSLGAVYSAFLPWTASVHCRHSQAARATPSNHAQRSRCSEQHRTATRLTRGGRPRLRRCAEFRSRMTSDSGSDNMARAKEKQLTSSTPAAATMIVSDLALLCAAGLLCNCSCQDV